MQANLETIFLCGGKISFDRHVGIIAVRETNYSEPHREKYIEGLGSHGDEEFTGYQISVGTHPTTKYIIPSRQNTC
jgi:hypothetical protein